MAYDNHFQDEPTFGGADQFDDIPISSQKIQFEGLKKAAAKAERKRERKRRRNERTGKIAACVLLVLILIGVIVAVSVVEEAEKILYQDSLEDVSDIPSMSPTKRTRRPTNPTSPSPTVAPKPTAHLMTPSPAGRDATSPVAAPTDSPTKSPAPTSILRDSYTFDPVADTYLHLNGIQKKKIHGREERLSVQRGSKEASLPGEEGLPAIVTLIEFDTTKESGDTKALPERSRWPLAENQVNVILRIHHVPKNSVDLDELEGEDDIFVDVEVHRLPNNHDLDIELLTGEVFNNGPKSVREGKLITRQKVAPTDTVLEIDVTSSMFLVDEANVFGDEQVLLLLKVYWEEKSQSHDLFESRESDNGSPQLIFSNMISEER